MKNLKLSWELSSNLQLQSENEVIRCTAFDIEQNRFFFASSANFIYTTHLPSSQVSEKFLLFRTSLSSCSLCVNTIKVYRL